MGAQPFDLAGQHFGRLTAIRSTTMRAKGSVVWECQCSCGAVAYVPSSNLRRGTKSCGCLRDDRKHWHDELVKAIRTSNIEAARQVVLGRPE